MLAIGCGSLFFSHVNDAGFWLVKEYFGLTIGQTIKSWSVMETAISVVGLAFVMLFNPWSPSQVPTPDLVRRAHGFAALGA